MSNKPSRIDQAYMALKSAIIEQALRPGDKLPEDEVGQLFSMSRTLVRQVFSRLNAEGLIEIGGKRPATVAIPSLDDAVAAFEVRQALEREVVNLVIKRWSEENAARLEAHVAKEVEAAKAGNSPTSIRLAGEFHTLLAEMSGNPLLSRFVSDVVSRCSVILAVFGRPHSADCGVHEHREIIDAIAAGDAAKAWDLMHHHLGEVEARALITSPDASPRTLADMLSPYVEGGSAPAEKPAPGRGRPNLQVIKENR
ncbi:MAG: transcriptional regulator [Hoeflea sp.]|uniref:GntR family transcriptional regulator n=1 Tax=Hoeflea sp. TaxID=1940281 RepID=UPI000C105AF1|nr:GntR family transcriptional regulator [Hoeflea sp.]PHR17115.1 MAG: transcriptional regulator [Hoeflea sp.]